MPLFELFRLAEGKLKTIQEKSTSCSIQSSSLPENEFAELVWENGHVAMQGQCGGCTSSNRARKGTSSSLNNLDFRSLGGESNLKAGKIGSLNCELKEFPASVPSGEIGVDQNDDMVPWLNHYSMPGSLQSDYNSYFLADLPVLGVNEPASMRNNVGSQDKGSRAQAYRDPLSSSATTAAGTSTSTTAAAATTTTTSTRLSPNPFPSQTSFPSYRSRAVGSTATSTSSNMALHSFSGDSPQLMGASSNNSTGLVNFACFSRPAALAKGITESSGKAAGLGLERAAIKEGGVCNIKDHNPCGANLVVDLMRSEVKPNEEIVCAGRSEAEKLANRTVGTNAPEDGEKILEAVGGSSSVCSRNSVEGSLDDTKHNLKRKSIETDSEDNSADMEDELVSTKKQVPPRGTSARRSRAAEVHNLSERRRRDRINEKMRALQELIPNCNKVDKASMLDEVIEYLKTLQLQLQMMTTGASLYMPPAMLPTGMQHMHPAHMVHFPNIGMGMGTGVGFGGMGMVDMSMQGAHFPHPLVSGTPALQSAMAVPNFQMYGLPNQGLPMLVPRPPFGPSPAGPRMTKATGLSNANEMLGPGETGDHCPAASTNESIQNVKKQSVQNTGSRCLTRQMSIQSALPQSSGQPSDTNGRSAAKSASNDQQ